MKRFGLLICLALLLWPRPAQAQTPAPVVRAVLFYSPSCGHCHHVINEVLPPLIKQYGEQLQIIGVDVTGQGGQQLFIAALTMFGIEEGGVPFLVIGDTYLFGSLDIPEKLPGLIEQHLAAGGLDWPAIPGLAEAMAASQPAATPTTEAASAATLTPTPGILLPASLNSGLGANFAHDLTANILAVIVLIGMIASAILAAVFFKSVPARPLNGKWAWAIPLVCLIGFGVAGYLAYVEMSQVQAICGPVGDCNTVQQSEYARLFGVLPIGVMGLIGYFAILLAWLVGRYGQERLARYAALALLAMSIFGLLFSIYLTFLEPFVIGATCAWCLTSAVLMTILFWLALPPGKLALQSRSPGERSK
jgi:uncharacterized membrane protein